MPRPRKPYHRSWDHQPVPGLCRDRDGRWRVVATGQRFVEPDERQALSRFAKILAELDRGREEIALPVKRTGTMEEIFGDLSSRHSD